MKDVYENPSAVILILTKIENGREKILLQRRQNTGFADGLWDFSCSGKVEEGESMTDAAVREAYEEIGVRIDKDHLKFAVLVHKRDIPFNLTYYNGYFICGRYEGQPRICEKEKCSDLKWFDSDNLPSDLMDDRRAAIELYKSGAHFLEYGWRNV